jgi:hypothetical protein
MAICTSSGRNLRRGIGRGAKTDVGLFAAKALAWNAGASKVLSTVSGKALMIFSPENQKFLG